MLTSPPHPRQDNLTLELRVHPPEVTVDNTSHEKWTVVTIDSANRPGSLIHVRRRPPARPPPPAGRPRRPHTRPVHTLGAPLA